MKKFDEVIKEVLVNKLEKVVYYDFAGVAKGFKNITISDDYIVTIRYEFKEFKEEGSLSFKDVVSDLIEDNVSIEDILYNTYIIDSYIKGKLQKFELIARKKSVKIVKQIIEKASKYIEADIIYNNTGGIYRYLGIYISGEYNFFTGTKIFLEEISFYSFHNLEEFEEKYLKIVEKYEPLVDELLKSENLDGNSFKYLFKEIDKKTKKYGIEIDYNKSTLPVVTNGIGDNKFDIHYGIEIIKYSQTDGVTKKYINCMDLKLDDRFKCKDFNYSRIVEKIENIADKYYEYVLKELVDDL